MPQACLPNHLQCCSAQPWSGSWTRGLLVPCTGTLWALFKKKKTKQKNTLEQNGKHFLRGLYFSILYRPLIKLEGWKVKNISYNQRKIWTWTPSPRQPQTEFWEPFPPTSRTCIRLTPISVKSDLGGRGRTQSHNTSLKWVGVIHMVRWNSGHVRPQTCSRLQLQPTSMSREEMSLGRTQTHTHPTAGLRAGAPVITLWSNLARAAMTPSESLDPTQKPVYICDRLCLWVTPSRCINFSRSPRMGWKAKQVVLWCLGS